MENSALNNEFITKFPYHLVQFISRGRQSKTRKTDIVASKWLKYNLEKKMLFVRYPNPPYDSEEYDNFLVNLIDVRKEWPSWHVKILGKASKIFLKIYLFKTIITLFFKL